MRDSILVVNDIHVDNNLNEVLAYVNLGSIVNSRPNNSDMQIFAAALSRDDSQRKEFAYASDIV